MPAWAKDPAMGNQMINARPEMLAVKPSLAGRDRNVPNQNEMDKNVQNGSSLYFKVFFGI